MNVKIELQKDYRIKYLKEELNKITKLYLKNKYGTTRKLYE